MKKYKLMVVGAVGSGKSSLISYLNGNESIVRKTQAILYDTLSIDTPGEYMENPSMYKYIMCSDTKCRVCIVYTRCYAKEVHIPARICPKF